LAYLAYIFRLASIAKRLKTSDRPLLLKIIIRSIAFGLIIFALMGPSFGETNKEINSEGKDIYIAVDLSQSMNAEDVEPSRLSKIKYELSNIIEAFSSDRIGLIIFHQKPSFSAP
jgi:Ca-activated chloride channel family protein